MNRGWVYAGKLQATDILRTESIWGKIRDLSLGKLLRRFHVSLEHTDVSPLVPHQVAVHESQKPKVAQLRRAWDNGLRTLAGVSKFLSRHGAAAYANSHGWANQQRWAVQSGELSLGGPGSTGQQSQEQCAAGWKDAGATCEEIKNFPGSNSFSDKQGPRSIVHDQTQEEELRAYGPPDDIGRLCHWIAHKFSACFSAVSKLEKGSYNAQGYLACVGRAAQNVLGLLVGVRAVGRTSITEHGEHEPKQFVNFLTNGDHTFFADGVLTHNCGVGGSMTGRGANYLVIDDPHSEQDALSETAMERAYEWYTSGPRQRLQPGGRVLLVMTRWSKMDLTEMVLKDQAKNPMADKWEVIEFPAIMPSGKPCWPEFWKKDDLLAVKASLPVNKWNAQWQQNPTSEEGAIFKREWWRVWQSEKIPTLQYVIQSYDTAYSKKETADFSAITTWGVFRPSADEPESIILLDAKKGRWDFPELKRVAFDLYKFWDPDCVLVEAKAAGLPLSQELRRTGIPVVNYSPGGRNRSTDKVSRANSVSPLFEAGFVWAPDEPWAEELVEEMAEFPYGEHDDLTDSAVQAIMRFRLGNFLELPSDYVPESIETQEFSYY
jgi:predicted phage terminase large subunit-like protein